MDHGGASNESAVGAETIEVAPLNSSSAPNSPERDSGSSLNSDDGSDVESQVQNKVYALGDEEVEKMLEGIEKIAQCPVCLELAKAPVAQCQNGHITCGRCREPLSDCPVCRDPFIVTVNRVVGELLNFLPKACPYTDKGCDAVILKNHSQYCEFRQIKCIVGEDQSCYWSGTIKEWKQHVKDYHPNDFVEFKFFKPKQLSFKDFNADWQSYCYFYKVVDEIFLFYVWKDGNKFCIVLKHVQLKKNDTEIYFNVKFERQEHLFYKSVIEPTPLKDGEPLKKNPVIFLLKDIIYLTNGDGSISADIEVNWDIPKSGLKSV